MYGIQNYSGFRGGGAQLRMRSTPYNEREHVRQECMVRLTRVD